MDSRIAIWNTLHDGEITVVSKAGSDLVMFVSIPYLRKRLSPVGDSFALRLRGFRELKLQDWDGQEQGSDLEADLAESGIEILSTESDTLPVKIATTQGFLILDFDSLEIALDTGSVVSYEDVLRVCSEYWDEWEAAATKK